MVYRHKSEENLEILTEIMIWADLARHRNFGFVDNAKMLTHDHEMPARGISVQKPSVHDRGRPQCEGELWSRLRITPTIVSNIENFAFFSVWPGHRGQPGESLRWSEGLAGKLRLGAR